MFFIDSTASEYTDLLQAEVEAVMSGTVVTDTPFVTEVTITEEEDDDDSAFNSLSVMTVASALAFATLQLVF